MSWGETIFVGTIGLVGMAFVLLSLELPYLDDFVPAAGYFPLWIATALVGLVGLHLVTRWTEPAAGNVGTPRPRRALPVALGLGACVALLDRLGFVAAVAAYVAFLVGYLERAGWRVTLASSVAIPGLIAVLFRTLLSVPLPRGPWGF